MLLDPREHSSAIARRHWHRSGTFRRWTNPQSAFLNDPRTLLVLWGCNGAGKSVVLAEYARRAIEGTLANPVADGPVSVGLFGETWQQLGSTIKYFWDSVDKRWFREKVHFQDGQLAGQRMPIYDVIDGPGKGSVLRMGTFSAGAQRLAGPRYHYVIADEPFPHQIFAELWPRLLGRNGQLRMGFTPTLGTAHKLEYLWDLVDDPKATFAGEIQVPLTLDAVTPRGGLAEIPWMTQEEIDRFERGCPAQVRDCRMGRSRVPETAARFFDAYGSHLHNQPDLGRLAELNARVGIGIDHGSKPGAQRAVMIATAIVKGKSKVWVLDEYKADGRTETDDDARGIMSMIERHGLRLEDVDHWVGDRAHHGDKYGGKKSNLRLMQAFSRLRSVDPKKTRTWRRKLPKPLSSMYVPRKYDGSIWDGCEILHRLMVADPYMIEFSPACVHLHEDLLEWRGDRADPHKDGIDALRYIVVDMTREKR